MDPQYFGGDECKSPRVPLLRAPRVGDAVSTIGSGGHSTVVPVLTVEGVPRRGDRCA